MGVFVFSKKKKKKILRKRRNIPKSTIHCSAVFLPSYPRHAEIRPAKWAGGVHATNRVVPCAHRVRHSFHRVGHSFHRVKLRRCKVKL